MAATTAIYQYTGSGPTGTSITNQRYCTDDSIDTGSPGTYPLVKPAAGTSYSYTSTVALYVSSGPAGSITNIKWYGDGSSYGTGITVKGIQTNTYTQAVGTSGTGGTLDATVYTGGTDMTTYTSASPLSVTSNATTGTGRYSYYVRSQLAMSTSVAAGAFSARTNTFRWDET